ncbi:MAG: hypothetical protein KGL39_34745 [Patescibacteria group bacterium]|nr:hypothetical protein [Patescibacteria group bacterium]
MTQTVTPPPFEPHVIVAGDNVQWTRVYDNYDPVNYTLSYALMPTSGSLILITAGNYGDDKTFWVNVPGATTANWTPSQNGQAYLWQSYITDGSGNRTTLYSGRTVIKPNFAAAPVADYRSQFEVILWNLKRALLGNPSPAVQNYTIRGRSLSKMSAKDIQTEIDLYEELVTRELRAEAIAQGRPNKGKLVVRFNDPTGLPVPEWMWMRGQW